MQQREPRDRIHFCGAIEEALHLRDRRVADGLLVVLEVSLESVDRGAVEP